MQIQLKFDYAMALTQDEFLDHSNYIKPFHHSSYWSATGANNFIDVYAIKDNDIEAVNGLLHLEVRPCLHVNAAYKNILKDHIGKIITQVDANAYNTYSIISDKLVLANFSICTIPFVDLNTCVKEANHYDKSMVKPNIDNWFNNNISDELIMFLI